MTFGSLFAGIGGLDLGLERAGMECRWQVERDDYCTRVLEKHWPNVKRYGDVKECGGHNLEAVDLVCGGFPCQPVSVAGQRKGEADDRWLWPEFYRIIRELRPRWVLVENVPGLFSVDDGRLMGGILRDLAEGGYDAEWDCIPAAAVGAPHLRYRVFIVAHAYASGCRWQDSKDEVQRSLLQGRGEARCQFRQSREVAYPHNPREPQPQGGKQHERGRSIHGSQDVAHPQSKPDNFSIFGGGNWEAAQTSLGRLRSSIGAGQWAVEPQLGRVAHGVPRRVDRLKCLGNAVVPQVAEWIGRRILGVKEADD